MRLHGTAALALIVCGGAAHAGDTATMTINIRVEPFATVETVTPPTLAPISRPNQTVDGVARFRVTTNHSVVAYLGSPDDAVAGPGGTFRYGESSAPLFWQAHFPGLAPGIGLPIRAGTRQEYEVVVEARTGQDWNLAETGVYTGKLSLTLADR